MPLPESVTDSSTQPGPPWIGARQDAQCPSPACSARSRMRIDPRAGADRVARVDAEVEEHLLELHGIGFDRRDAIVDIDVEADRGRHRRAQQLHGLTNDR